MVEMATEQKNNIVVLVEAVLQKESKYITKLNKKEFGALRQSGKFDIQWCYDSIHSVITLKGSAQTIAR